MASKKSRFKKKHYPVVRTAELSGAAENTALRILQVDQELSKLNRRLYRMGRYYECKIDMRPTADVLFEVYALRDDWAVQKGFQMAYDQYVKNLADEKASLPKSQLARWRDFRVETGATGAVLNAKLHQSDTTGVILTTGEFELANVTDAAGGNRTFTWSNSPSSSQYGILLEHDKSGDAQATPDNLSAVGPYEDIDSDTDAGSYNHLEQDGNDPPYEKDGNNRSTPFVRVATLGAAAGVQKLSTGFFTAPCGIVLIVGPNTSWNSDLMSMTVKSGDYKGVHAPSMLE